MPSSMFAQFATLAVILPVVVLAQSTIKPSASGSFCIQPQHGSMADGTPLVLGGCTKKQEQSFFLENGAVRVFNNMCFVAGAGEGDLVTIAQCDPANQAQQWIYDAAGRTFQSQNGSCLDLTNGTLDVGAAVGTAACAAGNPNQVWDVEGDGSAPPPETPQEPTPEEPTPEEPAPGEPVPEEPVPEEPVPGEPAPEEPAPGEPAPGEPAPGEPLPEEPLPEDPSTTATETTTSTTATETTPAEPTEPTTPPTDPGTTTPPAEGVPTQLKPGASASFCVLPQHGSMADGTPLVLGACTDKPEQSFFIENGGVRVFNNMCLVAGAGNGDLVTVALCDPANAAQHWVHDATTRTFQSPNGSCLDLSHGALNEGAAIASWACVPGNLNQIWDVTNGQSAPAPEEPTPETPQEPAPEDPSTTPTETMTPPAEPTEPTTPPAEPATGLSIKPTKKDTLCLSAAENKDGAAVVLAECNGDASQKWLNEKNGNTSTFRIFGDKCLDVQEGRNEKGTKMQIWSCVAGGSNQLFEQKAEQIAWYFFDKCLDVADGAYKVGQQVEIWQCSQSSDQSWVIA